MLRYNVASRIIYEWGTCTGAVRRLRFEFVNIEITQHMINWKHNFKILIDSVEDYARLWTRREKEELYTLSEWVKSVRSLIQIRIIYEW
jgi:hypothetical protein